MIIFSKTPAPKPAPAENETNRFEQVRKTAKEKHRKADAAPDSQPADDDKLI